MRPAAGSAFSPAEGYRIDTFRDPEERLGIPMLTASVSAERLFDVFLDLLRPLGEVVQVVLETSHDRLADRHDDLRRDEIDAPVLASYLCEFEELLRDDGCTGIAVLASDRPAEVQFDEHKLLTVYAPNLKPFRRVLLDHGIRRSAGLPLISEHEHLHFSEPDQADRFERLALRLGVGEFSSVFTDDW